MNTSHLNLAFVLREVPGHTPLHILATIAASLNKNGSLNVAFTFDGVLNGHNQLEPDEVQGEALKAQLQLLFDRLKPLVNGTLSIFSQKPIRFGKRSDIHVTLSTNHITVECSPLAFHNGDEKLLTAVRSYINDGQRVIVKMVWEDEGASFIEAKYGWWMIMLGEIRQYLVGCMLRTRSDLGLVSFGYDEVTGQSHYTFIVQPR